MARNEENNASLEKILEEMEGAEEEDILLEVLELVEEEERAKEKCQ